MATVVVVAAVVASSGPLLDPGQCSTLLPNTDFSGNDLPASEGGMGNNTAKDATQCCAVCAANHKCVCFSWKTEQDICYIKFSTAGQTSQTGTVGAAVPGRPDPPPPPPPAPPPPPFGPGTDLDCEIHKLALRFAMSLQPEREDFSAVALGLQVDTANTTHWSCFFGPIPPPPPPAPPAPPPPPQPAPGSCSTIVDGMSFAEEDGNWVYGKTAMAVDCETACKGNTSCTGFTWHDATCSGYEHLCYLVSNSNPWSGGERLLGHFSALCTQPPPPEPLVGQCSAIINSANLVSNLPPGTWLANATCQSAADCEASCKANSTCSGFTWHDKNVGGYALNCFFTDVVHPWSQFVAQFDHYSGLCNHRDEHGRTRRPAKPPVLQSYGGRLRSPLVWPVPGNGNDLIPPQGYLDPAAGSRRSRRLRRGTSPVVASVSVLYVDFGAGDDSAVGSSAAPLKTITAAVNKSAGMPAPRTIYLTGTSIHYVQTTVMLTTANSDTTITAAPGVPDAVISGGVSFAPMWTAAGNTSTGAALYTTPVPTGLTFLELFNRSSSARYVPAREPNGNVELDQNNYGLNAASWLPAQDFGTATLVVNGSYIDSSGKNVTIDRGGMFDRYYMGVSGPANNFKPAISYWAQAAPRGGGASTYTIPSGFNAQPNSGLTAGGKQGFVFMMQTHAWGSWVYEIAATSTNTDGTTKVEFGKGGQQEARGTGSPSEGGGSFYFSHRKEFLDVAGEWHLDEVASTLSLAVAAGDVPPAELVVPVVKQLIVMQGTQGAPVRNVRISQLTLRHAAPTFMDDYAVGSGGDYSVYRGGAVHLNGTVNCSVDHNLFDGVGGNAVWLTDFNRYGTVTGNEMRHIGENGVGMTGSTAWVDGRDGDQPRKNTIAGNLIHHLGLYAKQSCAVFSAVSCQNTITENIFFHGPRALVNMNDGFGGDTLISKNLFFASLLETSDHGPYNSWDRLPFLTDVQYGNGTASIGLAYNRLVSNFFFSGSPYSIDTDDGSDMVQAISNVIMKQPLFKTDYGGHTKDYRKNVEIFGGGCGCVAGDPTNSFVGNHCVGGPSPCSCTATGFDTISGNMYYDWVNCTTPVCPGNATIEQESKDLPLPTTQGVVALAEAALGMH